LPPDIAPQVAALVMRMLAKDPSRRFSDGAAVARAVAEIRGGTRPGFGPITGATAVPPGFGQLRVPISRGPTSGAVATGRTGGMPGGVNRPAGAPHGAMLPGRSVGGFSSDGYAPPAYAPPLRQPGPSSVRVQTGQPAPVNRRTGVAALIAVLVLLIVGIAGAILLTHAGTPGSSRDPAAIGAHGTVAGNFAARRASYSWWA
jgi:serine/threonine-protein kinase